MTQKYLIVSDNYKRYPKAPDKYLYQWWGPDLLVILPDTSYKDIKIYFNIDEATKRLFEREDNPYLVKLTKPQQIDLELNNKSRKEIHRFLEKQEYPWEKLELLSKEESIETYRRIWKEYG